MEKLLKVLSTVSCLILLFYMLFDLCQKFHQGISSTGSRLFNKLKNKKICYSCWHWLHNYTISNVFLYILEKLNRVKIPFLFRTSLFALGQFSRNRWSQLQKNFSYRTLSMRQKFLFQNTLLLMSWIFQPWEVHTWVGAFLHVHKNRWRETYPSLLEFSKILTIRVSISLVTLASLKSSKV